MSSRLSAPILAVLVAGCGSSPAVWYGYVVDDPVAVGNTTTPLADGELFAVDLDGTPLTGVSQPEGAPAGYWEMRLDVDIPVALRVEGPNHVPMVWRAQTPSTNAELLSGYLFARDAAVASVVLDDLLGDGASVGFVDGDDAALWGQPGDPEAWAGATLTAEDGEGNVHAVSPFTIADSGEAVPAGPDDAVQLFLASGLAPGQVRFEVRLPDGTTAETVWPARGGDMLSAHYYALPE